jgi:general stress protein YciG
MGTREGGIKAAATTKATRPNFYKEIGRLGGLASEGGGFAQDRELAIRAGKKGGKVSRRGGHKRGGQNIDH